MRYVESNEIRRSIRRPTTLRQRDFLGHFDIKVRARDREIHLRRLRDTDRAKIRKLLKDANAFTPEEISVAVSLIDEGCDGSGSYRFLVATDEFEEVRGYICYGQTSMTFGTWDIYWIVVSPGFQRRGIGFLLLRYAEIEIRAEEGRLIVIETSSKPSYGSTRKFYKKMGYHISARILEFYSEQDDKLIYCKYLSSRG